MINEAAWFWRLLFLNNNYHAVHHDLPGLPWFALRRVYLERRAQYLLRNGGFLVSGYRDWFTSYAAKPITHPVHASKQTGAVYEHSATRRRQLEPKRLLRRQRLQFRRFN
ncbi:hypothetical protein PBS_52680 [Paraburkholderia sp. 2C]